jgi:hypothetical protein
MVLRRLAGLDPAQFDLALIGCAPQSFDAATNQSVVSLFGEQYGMIERC